MDEQNRRKSSINFANLKRFHFRSKESKRRINYPPAPEYSAISEKIRLTTPLSVQCALFCGGKGCKYEQPIHWTPEDMALQGIFSHWITDDILAMARPNTKTIISRNIIQQFHSWGIRTVINLQTFGEHSHCGPPLESSGFTYDPNIFMENDIYYYNFPWKDYEDATLSSLMNMVKVLRFAIEEGRVAIHCHAGLGRTGVLIACFLIHNLRIRANDAVRLVRKCRPHSIQTHGQILCVQQFEHYLLPQTVLFSSKDEQMHLTKSKKTSEFTLKQHLYRQKATLHGIEEKVFKCLPKIVYKICERLLALCECSTSQGLDFRIKNTPFTHTFLVHRIQKGMTQINEDAVQIEYLNNGEEYDDIDDTSNSDYDDETSLTARHIYSVLIANRSWMHNERRMNFIKLRKELNESDSAYDFIDTEDDSNVLSLLLMEWLEGLKSPVLNTNDLTTIVIKSGNLESCIQQLDTEDVILIEYLLRFIVRLKPLTNREKWNILRRFLASLSQQAVVVEHQLLPENKFPKMREGTCTYAVNFLKSLLARIEEDIANPGCCDKDLFMAG